ncbi:hypothetical protein MFIFM68171_01685 [Madurella fahalii]|uniref:Uncharacterized protein n=1 Tax=Madurella fahalii TaxID=1157608 RepID=A0ABQ0G1P9_9PEZI
MHFSTLVTPFLLALGAVAMPVELADDKTAPACQNTYQRAALFEMWTTECNVGSGHTWGINIVDRAYSGLCFPLPDDTHALKMNELAEGCRITAYRSPTCDDDPYDGAYINKLGCLWTGGTEYRSYKLTCEQ